MFSSAKTIAIVLTVIAAVAAWAIWIVAATDDVLTWRDSSSGITFSVRAREVNFRTISELCVTSQGHTRCITMDDDVRLSAIKFVRYQAWLLVLNNDMVLAGYCFTNDQLVGEQDWDKLPFTVWRSAGQVVGETRMNGPVEADVPVGFKFIEEPKPGSRSINYLAEKEPEHTFICEGRLLSKYKIDGEQWNKLAGIYKYEIVAIFEMPDSAKGKLPVGASMNVVVPRNDRASAAFKKMAGNVAEFEVGATYRLALSDTLPKGWESIAKEFDDARIGLLACLRADLVSKP